MMVDCVDKIDIIISYRNESKYESNLLLHTLRSIDKNMKFINRVHILINDSTRTPSWLNTNRVEIIKYSEFIPEDILSINNNDKIAELFIHNIKTLSEYFIYIENGTIIVDTCTPNMFFDCYKCNLRSTLKNYDNISADLYEQNSYNSVKCVNKKLNVKQDKYKYNSFNKTCIPLSKTGCLQCYDMMGEDIRKRIIGSTHNNSLNIHLYSYFLERVGYSNFIPINVKCGDEYLSSQNRATTNDKIIYFDKYHISEPTLNYLSKSFGEVSKYEKIYTCPPIDENAIDAVILFCDQTDKYRQNEFIKYAKEYDQTNEILSSSISDSRFRDYGTIKYVLRSIEKNLSFVNKVHLVVDSYSQVPKWVNLDTVNIVRHKDFIPEEFLPLYNSASIEMFLHKIPNLSNRFIYFNDDMIMMKDVKESQLFNGEVPKNIFIRHEMGDICGNEFYTKRLINIAKLVCGEFNEECESYWTTGHAISMFSKKDMEYLYDKYEEHILSSISRFREDKNMNQYIYSLYSWKKGGEINLGIRSNNIEMGSKMINDLISNKCECICLNDTFLDKYSTRIINDVNNGLQLFFPNLSKYEKTPKTAVCVISKSEELYLIEWVNHYKKLGFDNILFYDNNELGDDGQLNVLENYIADGFVIYHDWRGIDCDQQFKCYQNSYEMYSNNYDWIAFFDVDEFLELVDHNSIQDFITSNISFNSNDIIHFSWMTYGDNELLYYENKPVQERFLLPSNGSNTVSIVYTGENYKENLYVKSMVRTKNKMIRWIKNKNIIPGSAHAPGNDMIKYAVDPEGNPVPNIQKHICNHNVAYLKHYRTKTIEEYLYKFNRGDVVHGTMYKYMQKFNKLLINRFFSTNTITDEKLQLFKTRYPNIISDREWEDIIERGKQQTTSDIDYIFPYVDGSDLEWLKTYQEYHNGTGFIDTHIGINSQNRYCPRNLLRYKFRSIEKHIPWIRNVFMIVASPSQVPEWLDTSIVKIVYHKDFIPEEFLPTFSSLTIEMFLSNIKELSENFIYSNDDMFFINDLTPYHFFYNNMPVNDLNDHKIIVGNGDKAAEVYKTIYFNSTKLLLDDVCYDDDLYAFRHCSKPFKKSTLAKILEKFHNDIYESITQDRDTKNLSMMQMGTVAELNNAIPNTYSYMAMGLKDDMVYFYKKLNDCFNNDCCEMSIDANNNYSCEKEYEIISKLFDETLFKDKSRYELY